MFTEANCIENIAPHEWQDWTPQAIECYLLQCDCAKCSIYNQIEVECFMYKAVAELLKTKGKPELKEDKYFKNLDKNEMKVMDAIIEGGCRNKQEIMQTTGLNDGMAQLVLGHLYMIANTYGCKYGLGKIKFNDFLKFVLKKFKGEDCDNDLEQKNGVNEDVYNEIRRDIMVRKKRLFRKRKIQIKIGRNY